MTDALSDHDHGYLVHHITKGVVAVHATYAAAWAHAKSLGMPPHAVNQESRLGSERWVFVE